MMMKTLWMMVHSVEWWHGPTFGQLWKEWKQTLDLILSDQILLEDSLKWQNLTSLKSPCKSMFDHWRKAAKTDTNTYYMVLKKKCIVHESIVAMVRHFFSIYIDVYYLTLQFSLFSPMYIHSLQFIFMFVDGRWRRRK